jgi:hypothetical protein
MDRTNSRFPMQSLRGATLLAALFAIVWGGAASAGSFTAANGLRVRIHTPADLAPYLVHEGGALLLRHPALGEIELLQGTDDPRLTRRDAVAFLPLPQDAVAAALGDVHSLQLDLDVDVFLLPAPPADVLGSFARGGAIVLSPAFGPVAASTVADVTVHELGHVLTWACLDRRPELWSRYLELRGLAAGAHGPEAPHAERAREILAEDIRFLFGGALATASGAIENASLAKPDQVDGLREFLCEALRGGPVAGSALVCTAYPNPCNPLTTVAMALPADAAGDAATALLTVYDLRGQVVRTVRGGEIRNGRLLVAWDGHDDAGRRAASGRYAYALTWQRTAGRGTVTVAR